MKIVLVEWEDVCSTSQPVWQEKPDIKELNLVPCVTVGMVLSESDDDYRITLSTNPCSFSQAITIPKRDIKRIRRLKIERRLK